MPIKSDATLYYIHDPMCSWCWGYSTAWKRLKEQLHDKLLVKNVLGGLAPDSDKPMSEAMQIGIRENWQRIQQEIPGTKFNYDFWTECQPRRSTYPACRAVISCSVQESELEEKMITAIQHAYYLDAKNPSDDEVLIGLAKNIGLNENEFKAHLNSEQCNIQLIKNLQLARKLGVYSFPSLVLVNEDKITNIPIDYVNEEATILLINQQLNR